MPEQVKTNCIECKKTFVCDQGIYEPYCFTCCFNKRQKPSKRPKNVPHIASFFKLKKKPK